MALQVWLPLLGNLENHGVSDITVSNNGATVNANGKIGSCYYFNGSSQWLEYSKTVGDLYSGDFSYAIWLKPTDKTRGIIFSEYSSAGASNVAFELTASLQVRLYWNGSPDIYATNCTLTQDVWTHVAITRSGNVAKFYINGVLTYTYSGTLSNKTTTACIRMGDDYRGGTSVSYQGYMNDARLYNHCLSDKEVKEIAKGLIAHYPLNGNGRSNKNYLKNSNFLQGTNGMEGYTVAGSTCTKQTDCMKVVSTSASSGFYTANYDSITTGDIATFSAWVKADSSMTIYIGVDGSGTGSCQSYTIGTTWQKISITKAKTTNNPQLRIYGNGTFYTKLLKYEIGSIATPWMPNQADALYSTMGYNSTSLKDTSGNKYNGTIGAVVYSTDTARNSVSTVFSSGVHGVIESLPSTTIYTFLWWGKFSSASAVMMWGYSNGNRLNLYLTGGYFYWNTNDGRNNPFSTISSTAYADNNWHHFAVTSDGTTTKLYIDGAFKANATTNRAVTGTTLYFNGWDSGSSYNFNGSLSDFRFYATCLSADDIKELYSTSASIDNKGTIYVYEFNEG